MLGGEPFRTYTVCGQKAVHLLGTAWRDPRRVVERRIAEETERIAQPIPRSPLADPRQNKDVPASVPVFAPRPVDARERVVDPLDRPGCERISSALRKPDRPQPALPNHPRDGGTDRGSSDVERCKQPHQRGDRGAAAACTEMVAVKIEKRRSSIHAVQSALAPQASAPAPDTYAIRHVRVGAPRRDSPTHTSATDRCSQPSDCQLINGGHWLR